MKLPLSITAVVLYLSAFFWINTHEAKPSLKKEAVISCYDMGTVNEFRKEASTQSFAAMHLSPKALQQTELLGKMIQFPTKEGQSASGYFIPSPKKSKKWLIVIQEWWGLNEHIKLEADKYYRDLKDVNVLAVDLYDGKVASTPDSAMKLMRGVSNERMSSILLSAFQHAGEKAEIYSVGWCFGGMWSLQTAILAGKQAKGSVMFYGRPETNLDKLKSLQCDILGFFGNLDKSPSPEMVAEFEKNMETAGKKLTDYKYEAGHGFANPSNPTFYEEASKDAYAKAIAFFKEKMN
jgi:carboxymethylenebutenolidase